MKKLDIKLLRENVEKRIENDISKNNISGASVAVISPDELFYKAHFGTFSSEDKTPLDDTVLFRMASMTKPVTAVAAAVLYDKGLIEIEDSVEKYLPRFKNRYIVKIQNGEPIAVGEAKSPISLKHLLTHTSGILAGECGAYYANELTAEADKSLESTVDYYSTVGLSFEPFTKTEYSGTAAFDVLARVIEVVSDMPYSEFVKKYITEPCGMENTVFVPSTEQWQKIIPMHKKENGEGGIYEMKKGCVFESTPAEHTLGGAGLVSSLDDYTCFARMLLNNGAINGGRVISEKAVGLISRPHVPESIMPGNERWGLGVRVIVSENYRFLPVGAYGWSGAYGTHFWIDPVNSLAAIYMKNSKHDGGSGAVTAANFEKDVFNALIG